MCALRKLCKSVLVVRTPLTCFQVFDNTFSYARFNLALSHRDMRKTYKKKKKHPIIKYVRNTYYTVRTGRVCTRKTTGRRNKSQTFIGSFTSRFKTFPRRLPSRPPPPRLLTVRPTFGFSDRYTLRSVRPEFLRFSVREPGGPYTSCREGRVLSSLSVFRSVSYFFFIFFFFSSLKLNLRFGVTGVSCDDDVAKVSHAENQGRCRGIIIIRVRTDGRPVQNNGVRSVVIIMTTIRANAV